MDLSVYASILKPYLASTIRHVMQIAAGGLAAHGLLTDSSSTSLFNVGSFVEVGVAVGLAAVSQLWSWWQKKSAAKALAVAKAAPAQP